MLKAAAAKVPVIASIYLDRPAILGNIRDKTAALLANFGASDDAFLDVMLGKAQAEGPALRAARLHGSGRAAATGPAGW